MSGKLQAALVAAFVFGSAAVVLALWALATSATSALAAAAALAVLAGAALVLGHWRRCGQRGRPGRCGRRGPK